MDHLTLSDRTVDLESGHVSTGDHLRPMELRVLRYLAGRGSAAVTFDELLGGVWRYAPGVRTRTVHSTVYRLRRAIEAEPGSPVHLVTVAGGVRLDSSVRSMPNPTNLTPKRDAFVGRTAELALLNASDARLISVVGPSGIGKTRLVTEWASIQLSRYPGGVWFVDVAGVRSASALVERLASTFRCAPHDLAVVLATRPGETLLVIDDLPSDLPGLPAVVDQLADLPGWRLIVSAHAPLGISGEQRIRLGPLGEDDPVGLLVARIREDEPLFRPEDHAEALGALSLALEGSPLALEIAASHAALLGPAQALEALRASGRVETRRQDRPEHHRSTEAMIAHTWTLLPDRARRALLQLGVFERTFPLDLACRLLEQEPGVSSGHAVVSDLIARGLVTSVGPRYRLYDLVRAFVRTQDIGPELRARVVAHYVEVASVLLYDGLSGDVPIPTSEELAEWESVALDGGDRENPALLAYTGMAALRAERQTLIDTIASRLERTDPHGVPWARFRATRAMFLMELLPYPEGFRIAEQAAADLADLGLVQAESEIRLFLCVTYAIVGRMADCARALAHSRTLRATLPAGGRVNRQLELLSTQADIHLAIDGSPETNDRLLAVIHEVGHPDVGWAKTNLVSTLMRVGHTDRAEQVLLELVTSSLERTTRIRSLSQWAQMLAFRGRGREAIAIADEAVDLTENRLRWAPLLEVYDRRIAVRLEVGDLAGAEQDLAFVRNRAWSERPPRTELSLAFGWARIEACRGGEAAVRQLEDVVLSAREAGLSFVSPLVWLARTHVLREDWEAALATLDEAPLAASLHPDLVRIRVEALRGLEQHGQAVRFLSRLSPALDGFGWVPQAQAAASWEAGLHTIDLRPIDDREPWSRVWLARIARIRGDSDEASLLLDGCTHTTRPLLLVRAIDELRTALGTSRRAYG